MAFPQDVLTAGEQVVLHLRPHRRALVRPVLVVIAAVTGTIAAAVLLPANGGGRTGTVVTAGVAAVFVLWKALWPVLTWRGTHYVFTDERVLLQHGVLTRDRRDLPLARINDHVLSQRFVERLFGSGTLTIDSIGDREPAVLLDVPGVERVQTRLYELVEADRDRPAADDDEELPEAVDGPRRRRV